MEITINEDDPDALIGTTVSVEGEDCATITEIPDDVTTFIVECEDGPIEGSTVTITSADDKVLSLKEVEILTEEEQGGNHIHDIVCLIGIYFFPRICELAIGFRPSHIS